MDGCLTLEPIRIPRPQIYTGVDVNMSDVTEKEESRTATARAKYGDIPMEFVSIYRTKPTLGLAIEGGANTRQPLPRVINIQPGGSAFESGGLKVGHVILEVNGQSVVGLGHTDVAKMIAEAFKNKQITKIDMLVTETGVELKGTVKMPAAAES